MKRTATSSLQFESLIDSIQAVQTSWKGGGPLASSAAYIPAHELPLCVHGQCIYMHT